MDTSKGFIKMCEKAEEIQKQWKFNMGDFYWYLNFSGGYAVNPRIIKNDRCPRSISRRNHSEYAWLPRQDQLQKFHEKCTTAKKMLHSFAFRILGTDKERYYDQFLSMEQLWLAFVMKEKYNKVWDGKGWTL